MNKTHRTEVTCRSQRGDHRYRRQPRDPHQGANVLVIIDEVPEGNWGARGQTISLAMIADTVGLAKTGERFRSVRAYIDATARVYAAADYPADYPADTNIRRTPVGSRRHEKS